MALNVGELFASLRLDDSDFQKKLGDSKQKFSEISSAMTGLGGAMTAGVTVPILGVGAAALQTAGNFEQAQVAFTTMLGSAQSAQAFLKDLQDFANKTPFEFPGLVDSSRKLLAFGFNAKQIIPMMTSIGDTVAALGGGAFELDRVTRALGQMQAKGKVSAEEMMQLAELGIPAWELLADAIGESIPEAMDKAQKGAISSAQAIPALLSGMNAKFHGMMAKQSETFLGKWSTFKDQITATLGEIGKPLIEIASKSLTALTPLFDLIKKGTEWFAKLPRPIQTVVVAVGLLAAAVGPCLLVVGQLLGAWSNMLTLLPGVATALPKLATSLRGLVSSALNPTNLAVMGVALALGALIYYLIAVGNEASETTRKLHNSTEAIKAMDNALSSWRQSAATRSQESLKRERDKLYQDAKDANERLAKYEKEGHWFYGKGVVGGAEARRAAEEERANLERLDKRIEVMNEAIKATRSPQTSSIPSIPSGSLSGLGADAEAAAGQAYRQANPSGSSISPTSRAEAEQKQIDEQKRTNERLARLETETRQTNTILREKLSYA